ncbi:MAG: hypothetical protein QXX17_01120 [Conexivisphaerales archaeon]
MRRSHAIYTAVVIALSLAIASIYIYHPYGLNSRTYLYLSGYPLAYAESSLVNVSNSGYLLLHPGETVSISAWVVLRSTLNKVNNASLTLQVASPPWLQVMLKPSIVFNYSKVDISLTTSINSPLQTVSSFQISSNATSQPVTVYIIVVPYSELVVPQGSVLAGNSTGFRFSSNFLVNYDSEIIAISAYLSPGKISIQSSMNESILQNSTGVYFGSEVTAAGQRYSLPLRPSPLLYTFSSVIPIPASLIRNSTYNVTLVFHFADGSFYNYTQSLTPQYLVSVNTSSSANFTIIASQQGYNDSILHGAPQNPWPVITVVQGTTVTITVINNDSIEPHGFAINHYFDRGVAIEPGQSYTLHFVADQTGRFIIYCNIPCSIHVYMIAELVVEP